MDNELTCKFCGKQCKNNNSLAQHQIRCAKNPNRINVYKEGFNDKGRTAWNKGITGEHHHSEETIRKIKAKSAEAHIKAKQNPNYDEYRNKMSKLAKDRCLGGFHFRRGIYYNGIKLDSSYEVVVAESLDASNIRWERPGRFNYTTEDGQTHTYTPDFYLPDYDVYLDPKNDFLIENVNPRLGYNDVYKIKLVEDQNNIKVIILDKNNLLWESIKDKISRISSVVE